MTRDIPVKIIPVILATLLTFSGFKHPESSSKRAGRNDNLIKIGFLIQDDKTSAAVRGAELAIRKANQNSGGDGLKFRLEIRSMEGPWGTGSKQAVSLIFEEKVWALAGCHDGRNAHLVEQAATKSIVPFVSAWASDPTLSQAFVPWFFNCVPTDRQQAYSIINTVYDKLKLSKITVLTGTDYDSNMASVNFMEALKSSARPDPVKYTVGDEEKDPDEIVRKVSGSNTECLILFCNPRVTKRIILKLKQDKANIPVYSSILAIDDNQLNQADLKTFNNCLRVASGEWNGKEYMEFRQEYIKAYKSMPGMAAAYSYDAAGLLVEAIRKAGTNDREAIQSVLKGITYKGATGVISFDDKGNRQHAFQTMKIKDGLPFIPD